MDMSDLKTITCAKCGGSGVLPDTYTGRKLKRQRVAVGVPLQAIADSMGFTRAYLHDLEIDKRRWSAKLLKAYLKGLNERGA